MSAASAPRTARAIAREELTRAIVDTARRQLAEHGPAALSVRAVARELGMASSAVYRYFASRDELLTELIIVGYRELGEAARTAEAAVRRRTDFRARWLAFARGVRSWAVQHPHDYALIYGSPVPGYAAPQSTVEPATQVVRVLFELLSDMQSHGVVPEPVPVPRPVQRTMAPLRDFGGGIGDDLLLRGTVSWSGLIGTISLELFGHFVGVFEEPETYFEHAVQRLAVI
jgi:AcrR family transcriptional regulator